MPSKRHIASIFAVLPLIAALCLALWAVKSESFATATSTAGAWDLRAHDFAAGSVRLQGGVEFIAGELLTPQEFAQHQSIARAGFPQDVSAVSTSRIRLQLPEGPYSLYMRTIENASRVFINGELLFTAGNPATTAEGFVPGAYTLVLDVNTVGGEVEIVQQAANFAHRANGEHTYIIVGHRQAIHAYDARQNTVAAVELGCFFALFITHITLFFLMSSLRTNLYAALFCAVWFLRTGVTGVRVFASLWPQLSWTALLRVEYLTPPLSVIALLLLFNGLFPGVLRKVPLGIAIGLSGAFCACCLLLDTVTLSYMILGFYVVIALCTLYAITAALLRLRDLSLEQRVTLVSMLLLGYAIAHEILFYLGINIFPVGGGPVLDLVLLIFIFYQLTVMIYGTVNTTVQAQAREIELRSQNEELARLNQMRKAFLNDMSHEMRTPLSVMSGYAQLSIRDLKRGTDPAEIEESLSAISEEAQRLSALVSGLLNLDDGTRPAAAHELVNMRELLGKVGELYRPIVEKNGNALRVDIANALPRVSGNAEVLRQALINLLANAARHTSNGTVTIHAMRQPDGNLLVGVRDTGTGVDEALLEHIFERGVKGEGSGSGLGLAITRRIVLDHGGAIEAHNAPGGGFEVTFTLPAAQAIHSYQED